MAGTKRTVRHAGIQWMEDGVLHTATRGQEVTLPADVAKRLDRFGALASDSASLSADLFPVDGSQAAQVAWLSSHNVEQAVDAARGDRAAVAPMLAAEQARGSEARATLVRALSEAGH